MFLDWVTYFPGIVLHELLVFQRLILCQVFHGSPLQYSCLKIPWMEEPGSLQSMGSQRVGHDWVTSLSLFSFMHWRRKWKPTPVFLPGESQGRGSLVDSISGVAQNRTGLKQLSSSSSTCLICYYFFPFLKLLFHLTYSFLCCENVLRLIRSCLFLFVFISVTLGGGS